MPLLFHLAPWQVAVLNVVWWAFVHAATGYAVHRLPESRLQRDGWLLHIRRWEHGGNAYRRVRIQRWKDRLPEAGALFAGGVSKAHLPEHGRPGLERLVMETRRAERGHWLALAGGPFAVAWNPPIGVVAMVAYGVVVNLPFIAVQRYNRARAVSLLTRSSASRRDREPDRSLRARGSSIP